MSDQVICYLLGAVTVIGYYSSVVGMYIYTIKEITKDKNGVATKQTGSN